jgi:hypothetical protein
MPAILNIISNRYENLKNNPNNVKPSHGVILCVIAARKNIKLGKLQTSQKNLHKMSYHVPCLPYICTFNTYGDLKCLGGHESPFAYLP